MHCKKGAYHQRRHLNDEMKLYFTELNCTASRSQLFVINSVYDNYCGRWFFRW